jgi:hypothetical protein
MSFAKRARLYWERSKPSKDDRERLSDLGSFFGQQTCARGVSSNNRLAIENENPFHSLSEVRAEAANVTCDEVRGLCFALPGKATTLGILRRVAELGDVFITR